MNPRCSSKSVLSITQLKSVTSQWVLLKMISYKQLLTMLGLIVLPVNLWAITLNDISDFLLDPKLTQMTPQELIDNNNFFGKLDVFSKTTDEMILLKERKPNTLDATYMKLDGQWTLNDVSFSYYASKEANCKKQQDIYIKHLTKKLEASTFDESGSGVFWQLPDRDWGIWLMNSYAINPFTKTSGCSSKMILVYSSLDAGNGDEDF